MIEINDEEEPKNYDCLVTKAALYEKSVNSEQNQSTLVLPRSDSGNFFPVQESL